MSKRFSEAQRRLFSKQKSWIGMITFPNLQELPPALNNHLTKPSLANRNSLDDKNGAGAASDETIPVETRERPQAPAANKMKMATAAINRFPVTRFFAAHVTGRTATATKRKAGIKQVPVPKMLATKHPPGRRANSLHSAAALLGIYTCRGM